MKRILLTLVVACALCTGAATAQTGVNATSINSKIERAETDAAHVKKGTQAKTWVNRGNAYFEAVSAPLGDIFAGVDMQMLRLKIGNPKSQTTETVNGTQYSVMEYNYFKLYVQNNKVVSWKVTNEIRKDATDKALESYAKALQLDPSSKNTVKAALTKMMNYYKQNGDAAMTLNDAKGAAECFLMANKIEQAPGYGAVDPMLLYLAGYMLTVDGANNVSSYARGEKALNDALAAGYAKIDDAQTDLSAKGSIYYYLFHCAYGQRNSNEEKLQDACKYLLEGNKKYPDNQNIFEGLLTLYTSEEGLGDPTDLLKPIEARIAANPNDIQAWFARGRAYNALSNTDECIVSFKKVTEIDPKLFDGHYFLGVFYIQKGDEMLKEFNTTTYTDRAKSDADIASMNEVYAMAIPAFEAAHAIKPADASTLELLKSLCFRLRDEPGVMEKYTKYNDLLKSL